MTDSPLQATVSLRGVILTPTGKLLIVRRASDSGWELPGGRLGAHEDTIPGLRREIEEETGLDIGVDDPLHSVSWRNDADRGRFAVYYRCRTETTDVTLSDEHTAANWVTPDRATSRLSEPQTRAVQKASSRRTPGSVR